MIETSIASGVMEKFDLVVYGASGFTGKRVVVELFRKGCHENYRIAIAGRDAGKLRSVLKWMNDEQSVQGDAAIIEADTSDYSSLVAMCKKSKVVLNCVGPYRFHGEPVVKACIEAGADYLDITGEPEFMERTRMKYNDAAAEKGVYIILACGFDCIPSELGMIYAKDTFSGTLGSVENHFQLTHGDKGMTGNYGTYSSLVNSIASVSSLRASRKSHSGKKVPVCGPKMKVKGIHRKEGKFALPFFGADVSVVKRSQRFLYEQRNETPAQFAMYYSTSFFQMICIILFLIILKIMTLTTVGTKLMLKYPSFFTAGGFTKTGPTDDQIAGAGFKFTMLCKGYEKIAECNTSMPYDSEMVLGVSGPEIGYALTPIALVQSACCVSSERELLPGRGGVYTPAPVFRDTSLIKKLQNNGVSFSIISEQRKIEKN